MEQALEVLEAEYTQDLFLKLLETDVLQDLTMLDREKFLTELPPFT